MKPPRPCPSCGAEPVRNDRHDASAIAELDAFANGGADELRGCMRPRLVIIK